jgi:hypothetical protein
VSPVRPSGVGVAGLFLLWVISSLRCVVVAVTLQRIARLVLYRFGIRAADFCPVSLAHFEKPSVPAVALARLRLNTNGTYNIQFQKICIEQCL